MAQTKVSLFTGAGRADRGGKEGRRFHLAKHQKPPSQTWRTFLVNHAKDIASIDFFTVPTAKFRVLYVFLVLDNARRRILHFNVTEHPTAVWTGQQMVEALPWDTAPQYLIRDRDGIYGEDFCRRVTSMDIERILTSVRSPWQNPLTNFDGSSGAEICLIPAFEPGLRSETSIDKHSTRSEFSRAA